MKNFFFKKELHGMSGSSEYEIWKGMMARCHRRTHRDFSSYGARGILVCKRWHKFSNFYSDMGPRPSKKHSIDRIDGRLGYFKKNCRWATPVEQANNRISNKRIVFGGISKTMAEWSRFLGGNKHLVKKRLKSGWSEIEAITVPMGERRPSRPLKPKRIKGNYVRKTKDMVIEFNGVSKTIAEWAQDLNMDWPAIYARLRKGWSIERALTQKSHLDKSSK